MNKIITSKSNEILKEDLKLLKPKYRKINNSYILFGEQLVKDALKSDIVKRIYTTTEKYNEDDIDVIITSQSIIHELTNNANVDIVAICEMLEKDIDYNERTIILDNLQDPGNVGTIIRTAKAFGFNQVFLSSTCASIYSQKTIRSMHGAHLYMNIKSGDIEDFLKNSTKKLITTFLDEDCDINDSNINEIKDEVNIMFGNEGNGIDKKFKEFEHINYKLKLEFESLNVAVAAGIIINKFC